MAAGQASGGVAEAGLALSQAVRPFPQAAGSASQTPRTARCEAAEPEIGPAFVLAIGYHNSARPIAGNCELL